MNVTLKSKVTKKGDLCICLIDENFPINGDDLVLYEKTNTFPPIIKNKRYYKMMNIGEVLETDNLVPIKYKTPIDHKMNEIKDDLKNNGFHVNDKSKIIFKQHVKTERKSCSCL
jgi:hypothetical protein